MADAVRLSAEDFRGVYEQSFREWSAVYHAAIKQPGLPLSYLAIQSAFRQHPSFPRNLRLEHAKYAKHSQIYATGRSSWASTQPNCEYGLPHFHQQVQINVASRNPIPLSIGTTPEREMRVASWFERGDQNYLAVLMLAWAYILSARWAEIMPGGTSLVYTSCKADDYAQDVPVTVPPDNLSVAVDIRDAGPDEARWWAAVLAPDQGWQATMLLDQDTFFAPWSVRLQPGCRFVLLTLSTIRSHSAAVAPSSSEALRFLENFCVRRNITDQSQAALAAVLLFPSMGNGQGLQLPAFATDRLDGPTGVSSSVPHRQGLDLDCELRHTFEHKDNRLDKLITLSCHVKGIRPMLLSSFYNPSVECNAVTPWLQGALAAINLLAQDDPLVLGRMLMDRQPKVAPLWLGITVLGLQKRLLQDVGYGLIPVDLHAAVWSGTIQSFIQQPVSDPLVVDGQVSRADQCRLLFLSRSGSHDRVPVCQWRPFGGTPLEHTDIEVRVHAKCKGHGLRYQGFIWDCVDGNTTYQALDDNDVYACPSPPLTQQTTNSRQNPVIDYKNLDREKDFVSENATRSIFGWLRVNGYALDEQDIWKHEWLDMHESDEEVEERTEESSGNMPKSSSYVETWISELSHKS
ncbi:hypothetical protein MYCTH_2303275 [Thermothelomyces thermophilus ATCC 42464]|uniref:Uncharacterized protein n=1 Tax=Thermothelomyces thermophilus (strain ATCC 42464 / BCRC 31852 / DSM 1799) TaxID=573729 RepID=G2QCC2_THET4|nr:uncharacterized protein MYCTH_2303275 [Thermothelomyces thermophilus ATCC 42464]AEO57297.1 hypothetical protein MYCTH_2303275 [Thermothelomyces thermophilus ATCC 42464]